MGNIFFCFKLDDNYSPLLFRRESADGRTDATKRFAVNKYLSSSEFLCFYGDCIFGNNSLLTLKRKYKILMLTKIWGQFDPKDWLNPH